MLMSGEGCKGAGEEGGQAQCIITQAKNVGESAFLTTNTVHSSCSPWQPPADMQNKCKACVVPAKWSTHCTNCQTVGKTAALLSRMLSVSSVAAATLCGGVSCDSSQSAGQGSQVISHSTSMIAFSSTLLRCSCLGLNLRIWDTN